jgi:hypothetical protein
LKQLKVVCRECNTENDPDAVNCSKCGLPLAAVEPHDSQPVIVCPRCQHQSDAGSFFCYNCGKYFASVGENRTGWRSSKRGRHSSALPAPKARILMPGGTAITLSGDPVFIERSDFDSTLPNDLLMCISRQHILITYGKGKYYLQDYGRDGKGSTNHTRLNGVDIYGKRKKSLKDGDKIELAGQPELTITFRLQEDG